MKLPSCPRTLIINILRKNPDGLTLTSIAELTGLHRHTATKYIYELKGAGVINERDVGSAKLCYLRDGFSRDEQKRVVKRLNGNGNGKRKSSTGQVQILTLFMFLFLVPASIIIAQNATQGMNSTGELILGQINTSSETFTELNQTSPEVPGPVDEANMAAIISEPNETIPYESQTNISEQNYTAEENLAEELPGSNETSQNETFLNETVIMPEPENQTEIIELPEQENETVQEHINETQLPEILQPVLSVRISSQDKTIRGEQFDVSAVVSNTGNSEAKNVRMEWIIPPKFEIVSGQASADCVTISPDSECASSLTLYTPMSSETGKNEIRVVVRYEE